MFVNFREDLSFKLALNVYYICYNIVIGIVTIKNIPNKSLRALCFKKSLRALAAASFL